MEARAVKRLICVTGFGAGDSRGRGGLLYDAALYLFLGRIYADKDAQEWIIRRSRLDWTIVRPTILTTGRARAHISCWSMRATGALRPSCADVADLLVKQIGDQASFTRRPC